MPDRADSELEVYLAHDTRDLIVALVARVNELEKDMGSIRGRPSLPGVLTQLRERIDEKAADCVATQLESAKSQGKRLESATGERGTMRADIAKLKEGQTDTRARIAAGLAVLVGLLSLGVTIAKLFGG